MTEESTTGVAGLARRAWAAAGVHREIVVDPVELAELADSLNLARRALEATPRYANLEAGDKRGRVAEAVEEFTSRNTTPRDELLQQLVTAWEAVHTAARVWGETETCLVRALADGGSS
jgi:hypothetical protein